jgi:hypothetical protein
MCSFALAHLLLDSTRERKLWQSVRRLNYCSSRKRREINRREKYLIMLLR